MASMGRHERTAVNSFPRTSLALVLLLFLTGAFARASQAQQRPRILVTNDDGYQSAGLHTLVLALAEIGEVVVAAPNENKSGSSQSLGSLAGGLEVEQVEIEGASEAYAVWGTPASATLFGVRVLGSDEPFDVVVSGINAGANVGAVSHVSGTIGAAMQAIMLGLPAIAVSQDSDTRDYALAARYTASLISVLSSAGGLPAGVVLSINVPSEAVEADEPQVEVLPMGAPLLNFVGFDELSSDGGRSTWRVRLGAPTGVEPGTDSAAYLEGRITVAPLLFDWTAEELVEPLRAIVPQP